jgi:hypothetical protein
MACTRRDVLEALDNDACTVSELAAQLETSWRAAERSLAGCVSRGWAVCSAYADAPELPEDWEPYVMLTGAGEETLAEMRTASA